MSTIGSKSPEFRQKSATINHLSNETLLSIFQHLNVKDLICNRLVCKRFMLLCDAIRVPEIIISNQIENVKGHWFHTNRAFNYRDAITLSTFNAYRSAVPLDKFLKSLRFQGDYSDYKQLKLNNLTQLVELKIDLKFPDSIDLNLVEAVETDISLPNLKILDVDVVYYVSMFHYERRKFVLKTPKLETLRCFNISSFSLVHPDTIVHLELSNYYGMSTEIARSLTNVQYLKFVEEVPFDSDILSDYPRLRTLACNETSYDYSMHRLPWLRSLVEQKRILNRPEVRIFFQSVELVDSDKIDEFESVESVLEFQINNIDMLNETICYNDDYPFDYNELMEVVKAQGGLPDDFFEKYRHIPKVNVSGEVNQEHFLYFIKRLKYLKELRLNNVNFNQTFFDGLYELSELTELHMRNTSTLSYDFLFKLKLLEVLIIDHNPPEFFDLSLALFKELKYLRRIDLHYGEELVEICRKPNGYAFRHHKPPQLDWVYAKEQVDFEHLLHLVDEYKNRFMVRNETLQSNENTSLQCSKLSLR